MNIARYEPWRLLGQIDQLFTPPRRRTTAEGACTAVSDWMPAMDIKEKTERFVIHADIPGVDRKDIEVHMENGVLAIKDKRESVNREGREDYRRIERAHDSFLRRFSLPDSADAEGITATSQHGVLEVTVPKRHKAQPRRIDVTD